MIMLLMMDTSRVMSLSRDLEAARVSLRPSKSLDVFKETSSDSKSNLNGVDSDMAGEPWWAGVIGGPLIYNATEKSQGTLDFVWLWRGRWEAPQASELK